MTRLGKKPWVGFLAAAVLLLCLSGTASAQQVFGSIYGTVTDKTGGAVANAKVTISDVNKGTKFEVTTNESGNYTKGQLIPGTYKVQVEAPGFQTAVSNAITVNVDQAARFDAAMNVGDVTQQVEVTAAAPLLQTDRADVAQTFSSKQLQELPNIGRNVQSFVLLNPGVVKLPWQHASSENPQGSVQTMVNGQYFDSTGYELDGTVNQDPILGIIVINPTMDSVNEVKQANQDYDAEFGYMGAGLLTYSTKSGSNDFHGGAFEYLFINTPGFQDFGRNPFNETTVPTTHQNQFGGSIGGRVIKDKLFFFADAQLTRNHQGGSLLTTVPTAAERNGDLSDWLTGTGSQIYDPRTGAADGSGRTPFAGNLIPTDRLNPQAQALLKFFPLPNSNAQGTVFRNNYTTSGTDIITANQWNTRWDYYLNDKNSLFGRYSYAGFTQDAPPAFGFDVGGPSFPTFAFGGHSDTLNQSVAIGWTHTASPTLINEFRFGYMRYHVVVTPGGIGSSPAKDAGIPGLNLDNFYSSGMPNIYIHEPGGGDQGVGGTSQLGYGLSNNQCNCPLTEFERQFQFVDNVTKISGNHSFKLGADIRYAMNLRVPSDNHRSGELQFEPEYTSILGSDGKPSGGLGLASYLLGQVTDFSRYVSSSTNAQERQKRLFWYAQDTWRPTSKLTINYGLRWEMVFPETVNERGNGAELDLATGNLDVFGVGLISDHGYQSMNWKEFAPRLGVAYQLTPKTVLRAGYGWSYSLGTFGSTFGHNVTQNPPVLANQSLNRPNPFSGVFSLVNGPPTLNPVVVSPEGTTPCPIGVDCKTRPGIFTMPVVYAYNATVEQQVTNKIAVSVGYVGNQGRHGPLGTSQSFNANEPILIPGVSNSNQNLGRPFFAKYGWTQNIDNYCNCANNRYDSLQALVKINAWSGYTVQGNFTYQISQGDGFGSDQSYTFLYDRPLGWGYGDNIPHRQFTLAQNYDIPFGRGRRFGSNVNRFVDFTLGGWNIAGITTYYSGIPFNPSLGSTHTAPVGPNDRPNKGSGDPYKGAQGNRNQWFLGTTVEAIEAGNGGAWALPATNTFGNYPINQLYGPLFINQDISLSKSFAVTERWRFTLRGDASNAFNHANLGSPNNNILDPKAGQITSLVGTYQMRRLQFSGTINF
jgi:outer membrane receptor protein involved in Fe transport